MRDARRMGISDELVRQAALNQRGEILHGTAVRIVLPSHLTHRAPRASLRSGRPPRGNPASVRVRVVSSWLRLLVVLGQPLEYVFDVRSRGRWRRRRRSVVAHGCSLVARSPEASRVSNTILTSGRADADPGAGEVAGGGVLASLIAGSSAYRARSP